MDVPNCENCNAPATHSRPACDCVYTEFGADYRFYEKFLCDECDPEREWESYLLPIYAGMTRNDYKR